MRCKKCNDTGEITLLISTVDCDCRNVEVRTPVDDEVQKRENRIRAAWEAALYPHFALTYTHNRRTLYEHEHGTLTLPSGRKVMVYLRTGILGESYKSWSRLVSELRPEYDASGCRGQEALDEVLGTGLSWWY